MKRSARRRVERYLRAALGLQSPSRLFIEGFVEGMALAELIAGWDLTQSLPVERNPVR